MAMLVIRGGGWLLVLAFTGVLALIPVILATQGGSISLPALLILAGTSAPLLAYAAGLARWHGADAQMLRTAGWTLLGLATIPLISFSFILWPLLLAATPTLFRWHDLASARTPLPTANS
jgi:hypothetical protein